MRSYRLEEIVKLLINQNFDIRLYKRSLKPKIYSNLMVLRTLTVTLHVQIFTHISMFPNKDKFPPLY